MKLFLWGGTRKVPFLLLPLISLLFLQSKSHSVRLLIIMFSCSFIEAVFFLEAITVIQNKSTTSCNSVCKNYIESAYHWLGNCCIWLLCHAEGRSSQDDVMQHADSFEEYMVCWLIRWKEPRRWRTSPTVQQVNFVFKHLGEKPTHLGEKPTLSTVCPWLLFLLISIIQSLNWSSESPPILFLHVN